MDFLRIMIQRAIKAITVNFEGLFFKDHILGFFMEFPCRFLFTIAAIIGDFLRKYFI